MALVVGDVVGHGLRAAATMGQLRNAFRAYGMVEASPAEVVARINRLVMSGVEEVMATVLYLVLDRETGEVAFSAAGHPPPLVLAPDGPRFLEGGRSVPIGAGPGGVPRGHGDAAARVHAAALHRRPRGAPRRRRSSERLDQLAAAADARRRPRRRSATRCSPAVLGDGEPGDDVALLAVRPAPGGGDRSASRCPPSPARWPSCGAGWRASCTPPAPTSSSSTRSRSPSARRPATRSSTPTARATRPTRSRWRSTPASSPPACATRAAGASGAASTAGAGSTSSRT